MRNWDQYFLDVCNIVASNTKCYSRKIGAIIVRDKSIISTGYNGPPRGIPDCSVRYEEDPAVMPYRLTVSPTYDICPRKAMGFKSGQGLQYCIAGHGERNTIVNAAREGISVKGAIMYTNCGTPCTPCMIEIINAGISEVVVTTHDLYDETTEYLLKNSNILIRRYKL